jgi:hypothetical protein
LPGLSVKKRGTKQSRQASDDLRRVLTETRKKRSPAEKKKSKSAGRSAQKGERGRHA